MPEATNWYKEQVEAKEYEELIKALDFATTNTIMYPEQHPLRKKYLTEAYTQFTSILLKKQVVVISRDENGTRSIINGLGLDETRQFNVRFLNNFKKIKADSIEFSSGMLMKELDVFITALGMYEDVLSKKGGVKALLTLEATPHIKAKLGHFKLVSEGQTVAAEHEVTKFAGIGKGGTGVKRGPLYRAITAYLKGEIEDPGLFKVDEKELVEEIMRNPRLAANFILQAAKETEGVHTVIERLGDWILALLRSKEWASRKDMGEVLNNIGTSIREIVSETAGPTKESMETIEKLNKVLGEYVERIKIDSIIGGFITSPTKTPGTLSKFFYRFAKSEEDKEKIISKIQDKLKDLGLPEKQIEKSVKKIRQTPVKQTAVVRLSRQQIERFYEKETKLNAQILELQSLNEELKKQIEELKASGVAQEYKRKAAEEEIVREPEFKSLAADKLKVLLKIHDMIETILENVNLLIDPDTGPLSEEQKRITSLLKKYSEKLDISMKELLRFLEGKGKRG